MATRSGPLLRGVTGAGGGFVNVVVPEDEIWILKSLQVVNLGTVATTFSFNCIQAGPPPVYASLANGEAIAAGQTMQLEAWIVVTNGDTLQAYAAGPNVSFWASGAALPD